MTLYETLYLNQSLNWFIQLQLILLELNKFFSHKLLNIILLFVELLKSIVILGII